MRVISFLFALILPTLSLADVSIGYTKQFFKGKKLDSMHLSYKKEDKAAYLIVGGSGKSIRSVTEVGGELNADLGGILSIELPQEYSVTKKERSSLWSVATGFDYHFEITGGTYRGYDWDMSYSIGPRVQWSMEVRKTNYLLFLLIEPGQAIETEIDVPTAFKKSRFDFFLPVCYNLSFFKGVGKACFSPNVTRPKDFLVSLGLGVSF